jgi:hypothetical protein
MKAESALLEASESTEKVVWVKYPDPYYWGAFIYQGDPSPLVKVESREEQADVLTDEPSPPANHFMQIWK